MKSSTFLASLKKRVSAFGSLLFNHSTTIHFVLFVCVLIGAIAGLNLILSKPSDEVYRSEKLRDTQSTRFDTSTIDKIQNLNAKQQTVTDSLPTGQRTNPFGE